MPKVKPPGQSRNKVGEDTFEFQCRAYKLPPMVRQFKLLKTVQTPRADGKDIPNAWRFDFCFPEYALIVEVDGGIFMAGGGAHSHPVDVKRNLLKRNDAALAGFIILAFMPEQIRRGEAIAFTQRVLAKQGWRQ
jgi:hypothetical protein